jgi:hypothetical protein
MLLVVARTRARQLDRRAVQQMLAEVAPEPAVGRRLDLISARLLGTPYLVNPLVGSAAEPEVLVATLEGFDCVTFMETALALAWARDAGEFLRLLREIRYAGGEVAWARRHHYTTQWARHHIRRGWLSDLTRGEETVLRRKTLDLVAGLPPLPASFRYFPKRKLGRVKGRLADGDLILFVSTRRGLDVFHTGLLFFDRGCDRGGGRDRLLLRHAARSRGLVVEQGLEEFMKANRMSGFIVLRPREGVSDEPAGRETPRA